MKTQIEYTREDYKIFFEDLRTVHDKTCKERDELKGKLNNSQRALSETIGDLRESREANAELLEALELYINDFWAEYPEEHIRNSFRRDYPNSIIVKAEAAIKKAKGE